MHDASPPIREVWRDELHLQDTEVRRECLAGYSENQCPTGKSGKQELGSHKAVNYSKAKKIAPELDESIIVGSKDVCSFACCSPAGEW